MIFLTFSQNGKEILVNAANIVTVSRGKRPDETHIELLTPVPANEFYHIVVDGSFEDIREDILEEIGQEE